MLRRGAATLASASATFMNRNPRNLERTLIALKPNGYHLEKPGRRFWHRLEVEAVGRHVTARVVHFQNGAVVEASTREWAIKKHLYSTRDACAYLNVGRVLAARCLRFGIEEMDCCAVRRTPKVQTLLEHLEAGGVALEEPPRYVKPLPFKRERPEKSWEIFE